MHWHWNGQQLELTCEEWELAQAHRELESIQRATHDYAAITADRLREALRNRQIPAELLESLSKWCNTGNSYISGKEPAIRVSRALFSEEVLPRLAFEGRTLRNDAGYQAEFREFCDRAGILTGCARVTVAPAAVAMAEMETEPGTLLIIGPQGDRITTLEEWEVLASPAGGSSQWKLERSAQELARRWIAGGIHPEVAALLEPSPTFAGFVSVRAYPETKTPLDSFRGNTRNQDLVVVGEAVEGRTTLDIEGKADESFGLTIAEAVVAVKKALESNSRSKALTRIQNLCRAVFGCEPDAVGELRYQLLHGVATAVIRAAQEDAVQVAFIVHEFRSASLRRNALERNAADLNAFVKRLGGDPAILQAGGLVGPLRLPGGGRVPNRIGLFVGKAVAEL